MIPSANAPRIVSGPTLMIRIKKTRARSLRLCSTRARAARNRARRSRETTGRVTINRVSLTAVAPSETGPMRTVATARIWRYLPPLDLSLLIPFLHIQLTRPSRLRRAGPQNKFLRIPKPVTRAGLPQQLRVNAPCPPSRMLTLLRRQRKPGSSRKPARNPPCQ